MKKILLATTGLVGAALFAGAASAETPKVTLGGYADFQAGYTNEDNDAGFRGHSFRNDNEITIHVDGKTDAGLGYGAVVDLEADVTNDADNQGTNAARTFTYLEGSFGRAEMGSNKDAAAQLRVDASSVAVATGGINGAWAYFANKGAATAGNYITNSKLFAEHGSTNGTNERTYNSTKISYFTPRFSGLQAGVSYTPDLADRGQQMTRTTVGVGELWDLALNYENQFSNGLKLAASGAYELGQGATTAVEDVNAWNIGAMLGMNGFSAAASYGDWSDSNSAANTDADYWTLGAGYEAGAYGLSATYLESTVDTGAADNDFQNIVLGADYKLAPGLTPYAEVSFYDYEGTDTNNGTSFILGTQLAF